MSFVAFVWLLFLGGALAALAVQFVLSRLALRLLWRLGETFTRLIWAHAIAAIVSACGWYAVTLRADPEGPKIALASAAVALIEFVVDALVLMRRRAKIRDAVYISRMR